MAFSDRLSVAASHPLVDAGEKKGGRKRIPFSLHMHVVFLCGAAQGIEQKLDGLKKKTTLFSLKLVKLIMLFFFFLLCSFVARRGLYTVFFFFVSNECTLFSPFFFLPPRLIPGPLTESHDTRNKHLKKNFYSKRSSLYALLLHLTLLSYTLGLIKPVAVSVVLAA